MSAMTLFKKAEGLLVVWYQRSQMYQDVFRIIYRLCIEIPTEGSYRRHHSTYNSIIRDKIIIVITFILNC